MARLECGMYSCLMHRMVNLTIVLPTPTPGDGDKGDYTYAPRDKYPVLYLLHGYCGDYSVWSRYSSIERYAEERQIAVVMFSGENKFYANHPGEGQYYDFMTKELASFITGNFPISKRPEDTYIAGLSMGGYGTLLHALTRPKAYRAFGSFSGAPFHTGRKCPKNVEVGETREDFIDLFELLKKYDGKMDKLPAAFITCGTEDRLVENNHEFMEQYKAQGGELFYEEVPGYKHEWAFWDREVERFLDWIPRTDAYSKKPKRAV